MQRKLIPDFVLARRLRVPLGWLREEAAAGRLPHVHAGERFLFDQVAVEQTLLRRANQAWQEEKPS